ncbi:hypothetical protein QWZ03_18345 [Chitinimonas viridis]|uniref:SLATT domain-containing protein n=1 Tax=Chitinimonas viridis TaxID=664880 RepID=A0ABT8BAV6_9NEIS|nr:hypothetical protein [Chitinimonas viridis]MDN3578731.1 hypothetical protein [Chitinimonas viridis]
METETISNEQLDEKLYGLLFDVCRSIRYHNRRRAFFDRCDMLNNVVSVVGGSVAVYGVLEQNIKCVAVFFGGAVTVSSAFGLVVGFSQRARAHSDFARQYIELEKKLRKLPPSEELFREVYDARLTIEAEEPPVKRVLDVICHNDQMRAMGHPSEEWAHVSILQRWTAQWFDWGDHRLGTSASKK